MAGEKRSPPTLVFVVDEKEEEKVEEKVDEKEKVEEENDVIDFFYVHMYLDSIV